MPAAALTGHRGFYDLHTGPAGYGLHSLVRTATRAQEKRSDHDPRKQGMAANLAPGSRASRRTSEKVIGPRTRRFCAAGIC